MAVGVLVAMVLAAMLLSAFFLVRVFDARTQDQWRTHQTQEADLWARMLSTRMEAHQRLLSSIAQGVHTSLLDKPEVLEGLMQQEGSMLRLFDSLHVALSSGSVSHYGAVGKVAEMDPSGLDALRRTITEGKPTVTMVRNEEDIQHLRALLTVPIRRVEGTVSGALAATVLLPLAALLPDEPAMPEKGLQYMLLDSHGVVLAHSDVTQRWKNVQELLGANWSDWQALSQPSAANADTQMWGHLLVTRVGLPLPQWQAVVLRDLSTDVLLQQGLPPSAWAGLTIGAIVLTLLASSLLWGWLAPWPKKTPSMVRGLHAQADSASDHPAEQMPPLDPDLVAHLGAMAMFEAVPSAMLLDIEGTVTMATPQVGVMLGYFDHESEALTVPQLFDSPKAFADVRHALTELGSFEGTVQLRKKDGDGVLVQALAWTPSQLPLATVWRLRLPWRQRRVAPLPEEEDAWCDALTGLPSREAFLWGLQSWVTEGVKAAKAAPEERAERKPLQGCLLFVDLDHLGMLNETTSREMGNKVLRHVGRLLSSYTQPLGSMARLGGDEFAVLLPGISLAHAQAIGQALCDAVWRWQPSWGGERHWVSISIGIVAVDAQRHTPQQALRAADMACYEAKRRGRCQVAAGPISAQPPLEV